MELGDVARLLQVADADVESYEQTPDGLVVNVRDGGRRLVNEDGVFACDDHPAGAQLRPWPHATGGVVSGSLVELESPASFVVPEKSLGQQVADAVIADVPDGTIDEVLAWVGNDSDRAIQAYTKESERDKPRSTLLAKLEELA